MPPEADRPGSLAVLIPAWNEAGYVGETVAASRRAMASTGIEAAIIVCDNNSTDATAAEARAAGADVVFEPHNQISLARNRAASVAGADWFLFLDADTRMPPGLGPVVRNFLAEPGASLLGSRLVFEPRPGPLGRATLAIWNAISRWLRRPAGSFILVRAEGFRAAGGFPPSVYAGEEILFASRYAKWARTAGLDPAVIQQEVPLPTSSRKLQQFSTLKLLGWFLLLLVFPLAIRNRRLCAFWYRRPDGARPDAAGG